jgi:hypothetical protein
MAKPPFPQQPQRNPYFDTSKLPIWMRTNLERGFALHKQQTQLQQTLARTTTRRPDTGSALRQRDELRRTLAQTLRTRNVTLSAQTARRLQLAIRAGAQELEVAGGSQLVASSLRKWDSFLEVFLSQ